MKNLNDEVPQERPKMLKLKSIVAVGMLITSGCASAYHCYECGCTPYEYCRRPALPYTTYESCCQTPTARSYSWLPQPSPRQVDETEMPVDSVIGSDGSTDPTRIPEN